MADDELVDTRVRVLGPPKYDRHGNYEITVAGSETASADLRVWSKHVAFELAVGSVYDLTQVKRHPRAKNRARYETSATARMERRGRPDPPEISLLHASDTHLGRETTSKDDATAFDYEGRFLDVVNKALTYRVDGLLLTGDIFDDNVSEETVGMVRDHIARLDDYDVPVYYVKGNHGCDRGDDLLEEETRAGRMMHLSNDPTLLGDDTLALYGMDNDAAQNGLTTTAPRGVVPDDAYRLLAWHEAVEPIARNGVSLQRLVEASEVDLDAVALGDLHKATRAYVDDARDEAGVPIRAFYAGATTKIATNADGYVPQTWLLKIAGGGLERHPLSLS